jgi:hypothetical protein
VHKIENPELNRLVEEFNNAHPKGGAARRIFQQITLKNPYGGHDLSSERDTGCKIIRSPYGGGVTMIMGDVAALSSGKNSLKLVS